MSKAVDLFNDGYNCSQSVFCAYCEKLGIDFETGLKLASSFGGGMGRLREVCGAVSGMFMLLGLKSGYTSPVDDDAKAKHYEKIQTLAKEFEKKFGSIICRELLALQEKNSAPEPSKRTKEFYDHRPCAKFIEFAANLIEKEIN